MTDDQNLVQMEEIQELNSSPQNPPRILLTNANSREVHRCPHCSRTVRTLQGLRAHITRLHSEPVVLSQTRREESLDLNKLLQRARQTLKLVRILPRTIREQVAQEYSKLLEDVNNREDEASWKRLLCFPYAAFRLPNARQKNITVTNVIRSNLQTWRTTSNIDHLLSRTPEPIIRKAFQKSDDRKRAKTAECKLAEGDIRAAVRVLSSTDIFAENSQETLVELQLKHPTERFMGNYPEAPAARRPGDESWVHIQQDGVHQAIRTFSVASGAGLDGLRPRHLRDLLDQRNPSSSRLANQLCRFVEKVINGALPEFILPTFYGAFLTALQKKDGGIRPIACGLTLRRLAAKVALKRSQERIIQILQPHQVGVCIAGGAEAAVHAVRTFIKPESELKAVVKLDFCNAFNSVRRDLLLRTIREKSPDLFPMIWQCYRHPTILSWSDEHTISSVSGVQQGDPLGPAVFSLAIANLVNEMMSPLNVWYLDDATLGGPVDIIIQDIEKIKDFAITGGVELNIRKCEVSVKGSSREEQTEAKARIMSVLPGSKTVEPDDFELLGAPIGASAIPRLINQKSKDFKVLCDRAALMHPQAAMFILRHSLGVPKVMYTMRTSPTYAYRQELEEFDKITQKIVSEIMNVQLSPELWSRISLPIAEGGWGYGARFCWHCLAMRDR